MFRSLIFALILATLVTAPAARADEPGPPEAAPTTPAEQARARDASIDRGLLMTHAETIGADRWTINSYELFLLGVTYGVSDDFQLSFTTSLPVVQDMPLLLSLAGKVVFYRDPWTVLALRGLIAWETVPSETDKGLGVFTASFFVDRYLDSRGRFALHGAFSVGGGFGTGFDSGGVTIGHGALFLIELGVTLGLADMVNLYAEVEIPAVNAGGRFDFAPYALVNYGFRFHGGSLAADLGFLRPVGSGSSDTFILGFPFVAFSARF